MKHRKRIKVHFAEPHYNPVELISLIATLRWDAAYNDSYHGHLDVCRLLKARRYQVWLDRLEQRFAKQIEAC